MKNLKKVVAMALMAVMLVCSVSALAAEKTLAKEEAVKIALDYAKVEEKDVTFTKVKLDRDDGRLVWEVEFLYGGYEYEFDIDALTGRITDYDRDLIGRGGYDFDDDDLFDFD